MITSFNKEFSAEDRRRIAEKLALILGADLTDDEEQAIYDAIAIVSPEYAASMEELAERTIEDFQDEVVAGYRLKAREILDAGLYDEAVEQMDDTLREEVRQHFTRRSFTKEGFLTAYLAAHHAKYGTHFEVI